MIIEPKVRGFICITAHPVGCKQAVRQQIEYVSSKGVISKKAPHVLIIGASTGYGLASRVAATFGLNAKTIGVSFEKPASDKRTASAGWYNTAAFEKLAHQSNHYAKSINGDAFSDEIKQQTIDLIKKDLGKIDLLIYSLASPRRVHPKTGEIFSSCIKPVDKAYANKSIDPIRGVMKDVQIEPATQKEIDDTVAVMGGEDWELWIDALEKNNLLADNFRTLAYTYLGPDVTHDIYKAGTIGKAKDHLQKTADHLNKKLTKYNGEAFLSVNKAVVTQASAAIPVVPLYISTLYKVMKEEGVHEGCIEQMYRLYRDYLYNENPKSRDTSNRIRLDDLEMSASVQEKVATVWQQLSEENLKQLTDIEGYRHEFYQLFGFEFDDVDYLADVDPEVEIDSIQVTA